MTDSKGPKQLAALVTAYLSVNSLLWQHRHHVSAPVCG